MKGNIICIIRGTAEKQKKKTTKKKIGNGMRAIFPKIRVKFPCLQFLFPKFDIIPSQTIPQSQHKRTSNQLFPNR